MKLHLIRHTSLNIPSGICYGQSDVDVSESFHAECGLLKEKLARIRFDAVYASPLQRCVKLAEVLDLGEVQLDHRLKELHFGDWEMQAWDSIPRDVFDTWAKDYANLSPPNGESFSQLHMRSKSFIEDVSHHARGQEIAVITHGGVIRAMLADVLNMPLKGLFRMVIDHASVTRISFDDEVPRIHFVNR
ncbi:alpha-ribazole phosphatase [Methylotenera sp. G11]|uniref:alpha-ribazole phosphatase n=1 Tax=Methylotenera sp. G11 TaxID=1506585 RepID=UPI00064790AA|nr:alpha-ribazole phosphatase [Methylotenera sp. G11]